MAKINIQKNKKTEKLKKPNFWLENKIKRVRSFVQPQAARFSQVVVLLILMSLLISSIYSLTLPKTKTDLAKERLIKNPNDIEAHLILAEEFLNNNQLEETQKELVIVQGQYNQLAINNQQSNILGVSSIFDDLKSRWQESSRTELEKLVAKWRIIVGENLEYRDGYLRLAIYYFKLGNDQKAKENLQEALKLDPNFEPAKLMEQIIR